jgi:hypothetical protein
MVCGRDAAADAASGSDAADAADSALDGPKPKDCGECFRAIRCVNACGGAPVSIGCCACEAPAFDDLVCAQDAAGGG